MIKKCLFPAAGYGTRFLPATKSMPKEMLPILTKPFFSTKPFRQGTGLGLNITKKIIADHGGTLNFESIQGEFTKVIIDLPAH